MFWYSRKTGFPKIKILPELRDDSRLGQCNWTITNIQSVLFVKIFHTFFGRAESNPIFYQNKPEGLSLL